MDHIKKKHEEQLEKQKQKRAMSQAPDKVERSKTVVPTRNIDLVVKKEKEETS